MSRASSKVPLANCELHLVDSRSPNPNLLQIEYEITLKFAPKSQGAL